MSQVDGGVVLFPYRIDWQCGAHVKMRADK